MNNLGTKLIITACAITLMAMIWITEPVWRAAGNTHDYAVQKVDDRTNYKTMKMVEDTCRTYMASYEGDKLSYETYKDTHPDWAEQAKIRANKTAASYNNYILKNRYVWDGNIPPDITDELEYLE